MTSEPCGICARRFGIGECNECVDFSRFRPDAAVQALIDRAFNQGVKAGLRLAIQEAEAHKGESPRTLLMKIRALLETK